MEPKRLLKPPVRTPAVDAWLKYWQSVGGQQNRGTPLRKAVASHAAKVRWAKHRKEPPPTYNPPTT